MGAAQLKEKRACIKAFGACRKQERALPSQMNNCMPKCNNAGGSTTPASSASSKNLENAKKIAEAATKALSNLAAALGVSSRALAKRQASDSSGCTEAKGLTESALTAGQGAVANGTQTSVDDTKAGTAAEAFEKISNRSTLKADIEGCTSATKTSITELYNKLKKWKEDIVDKVVAAIEKALEEESKKTTPKGDATGKTTPAKTTAAGETTIKKKSENEMKLEELSKQKEEKAAAVKGKNNFVMLT